MFGGYGAPSIADIAAVTDGRNNGGWGDGNGWWILIILFAIFGGWGRNGFGNGSGCGCDSACATVGDVERGFNQQSTNMRFNAVDGAFAQLGYANQQNAYETRLAIANAQAQQQQCCCDTQRAIAQAQNQLSSQLADCCCENRLAVANLNAAIAADTCAVTTAISNAARDITDNQNANYRALHDELTQFRMEDKDAQIRELQSQVQALNLAQSQANQNQYLLGRLQPYPQPSYQVANPYASYAGCGCCGTQNCCC